MLGERELNFEDYVSILRRRKWWIIVPVLLGPLVGFLLTLVIPNRYTSTTLVLVEQQKVPENVVKPVMVEDLTARLATMQEQILSRSRLQPIIEQFGLYKDQHLSPEESVDEMRKSIKVEAVKSEILQKNGVGDMPGFYISFNARSARLAQQVCGEITSMFMSENLRARQQSAQGTTDFLRSQVNDAKRNLDEQDQKLAEFQKKNVGQLPGQEQSSFTMLATLNSQLDSITQQLNRLQADRTYTKSMLSQQIAARQALQSGDNPTSLQQQLDSLQLRLVDLKTRYTDNYPDVIKTEQDIQILQKRLKDTQSVAPANSESESGGTLESHDVQQLRAQLQSIDQTIKAKTKDQERLQQQSRIFEARIQLSPAVQEGYKNLTRDYQTALQFYNELLTKKNQSEMATDLERRQQGEQFRVLDPPNLPESATFPNPLIFTGGGLAVGLFLGMGMVFVMEAKDKALRTEGDVLFYLELPVLTMMPDLDDQKSTRNGHKRFRKRAKKDEAVKA